MTKMTLPALTLLLLGSSAMAGTRTILAGENFAITPSSEASDCANMASVLSQISTKDLQVTIDNNCVLNKGHGKGVNILIRVLADIGSWGVNEIACKQDDTAFGCDDDVSYFSLDAEITIPNSSTVTSFEGNPVSMTASDCQFYASAFEHLGVSSKNASLSATCTADGVLQTALTFSK